MIATQIGPLNMKELKLTETKAIRIEKNDPNCVFVKYSYSDEYQTARIIKKKKKQDDDSPLIPCYKQRLSLAENKKKRICFTYVRKISSQLVIKISLTVFHSLVIQHVSLKVWIFNYLSTEISHGTVVYIINLIGNMHYRGVRNFSLYIFFPILPSVHKRS